MDVDTSTPFRHIVCPIDFSATSLRALARALVLAQRSGAHLTLLHVLENFPHENVYSGARAFRVIREFRARVDHTNGKLLALVPPDACNWCRVSAETVSGRPAEAILAASRARQADLIVMGQSRRSSLDRVFAGSTAKTVMRRAPCPVLVVPGTVPATERRQRSTRSDAPQAISTAMATALAGHADRNSTDCRTSAGTSRRSIR